MFHKTALVVSAAVILAYAGSTWGQIGPRGWWSETIGTAAPGTVQSNEGVFEVTGEGDDIWNNADAFQFMYKELTGDGSLTARVVGIGAGSNTWAKGGVMIRDAKTAGSEHAMMVMTANSDGTAGNGAAFQWRPAANGISSGVSAAAVVAAPYWVRIERVGDAFSAFQSADGQTWTQMGEAQTIEMSDPVYIGLCVTSHAVGELRTFTFDNVSLAGEVADRPPYLTARDPSPASGSMAVTWPLFQWTPGETAVAHNVYFGTTPELTEADLAASQTPNPLYYHAAGMQPGVQYYWRVDEVDEAGAIHTGDVWMVMSMPFTAYLPSPADAAEGVSPDASLSWSAGENAVEHQVYFGTSFADVNDGATGVDQGKTAETTFTPGTLRVSTTYYWRVDEIRTDGSVERGPVWSFNTQEGIANKIVRQWWSNISGTAITDLTNNADYPQNPTGTEMRDLFEGPVDSADNYGTRMYGWLKPPETGEYTFWISGDDSQELWLSTDATAANAVKIATVASWTGSREWEKEANQKSAPITLQAGQKYYIQALGKEGTGGDSIAVAWQGGSIAAREVISGQYVDAFGFGPLAAFNPSPAKDAVDVPQTPVLSWMAGEKAVQHEVYFGDDAAAVAAADASSPLFKGSQDGTTFEPGDLEWNKTYYWRVDEVNPAEPDSPWVGRVWSFTTADFAIVEDFEGYTDAEGQRIYEAWVDGLTDGTNGSMVGYLEAVNGTFGETTVVHSGSQSMPMDYNNVASPFYSEAAHEFSPVQDWTVEGVDTLSLWVRGYPAAGQVDVVETGGKMTVTGAGADIWGNTDEFTYAYKTLNGDGAIVARVVSIGPGTNTWAKGGVMVRDSLDGGSTHAMIVLTANTDGAAGNGASFQYRAATDGASANADSGTPISAPYWIKLERMGDTLTGFVSADGSAWSQLGTTAITMQAPVYIGLCVTSHAAGENRSVEFSDISTTGDVAGAWQGVAINASRQNSPQDLYVTVGDSAGKTATVANATAATSANWTEVQIPLASFAGVNMTKVETLIVGVGNRSNPAADGTGRVFIDDIRVVKSASADQESSEVATQ
ncbi:MAG: PA14 domain-containing protein [Solirubrobacterales bacterium]